MTVDPSAIELSPQQRVYIARQSERLGKPWPEILEQFVPAAVEEEVSEMTDESAYDVAKRLGLIGGVTDAPVDLAANPEHMEGFGR